MPPPRATDAGNSGGPVFRLPDLAFSTLTSWMNSAGTVWVFGLMFLICADIAARNLFNHPIIGVTEIVGFSIVGAVFLQLANTLHVGRFTRAEVLIDWMERRRPVAGAAFLALFHLAGAVVFGLIVWGSWPGLVDTWVSDEVAGTPGYFTFIIWPFRLIVVIGAAATAIEFAIRLGRGVAAIAGGPRRTGEGAAPARTGWPAMIAFAAFMAVAYLLSTAGLSNLQIGLLSLGCMLVLIYCGMHIGVALIVLGFLGIWAMKEDPALGMRMLTLAANEYLRNYFFGVIPLFVLMGLLVSVSDVGRETFEVARWALRRVKGGLGVATVAANAVFAAITGSSIASAAVFTKVASPEMMRHGYTPRFAVGVVAGSSVLGMLIPPSLLLIVYGFLAEQSVGILFLAAVVPGLILAAAMALAIVVMAVQWPRYVGAPEGADRGEDGDGISTAAMVRWAAIRLFPIAVLIFVVLGGIYGGVFTPTEAGAAGAAGALIIALAKGTLSWAKLWQVLIETGHITVSILFLILAANIYARMLALSGLPQHMSGLIAGLDLGINGFLALYILLLIVLGMFLDSVSIMLIVLPLALPVVKALGGDLIWFGIVTVIAVEIGLLTPPLGITCYVVKSTLDDDRVGLNDIFAGAFPFVIIMLAVTVLLVAVPELSLLLV